MLALGYCVPGEAREIVLEFLPGAEGYMWIFPRRGHLAVGICARNRPAAALRRTLVDFLRERSIAFDGGAFYAHPIPSLPAGSWREGRVAGDGWVAAGDTAGFADPITGEGIYYALRSGELAAEALLAADGDAERAARAYRTSVWEEFAADLEYAARIARRFYTGRFLYGPFTTRMLQFSRRSAAVRGVMQDLVAGAQPYRELKSRLRANACRAALEIAASSFSPRRLSREP
jgi:flavin-dependent dehydrogenase